MQIFYPLYCLPCSLFLSSPLFHPSLQRTWSTGKMRGELPGSTIHPINLRPRPPAAQAAAMTLRPLPQIWLDLECPITTDRFGWTTRLELVPRWLWNEQDNILTPQTPMAQYFSPLLSFTTLTTNFLFLSLKRRLPFDWFFRTEDSLAAIGHTSIGHHAGPLFVSRAIPDPQFLLVLVYFCCFELSFSVSLTDLFVIFVANCWRQILYCLYCLRGNEIPTASFFFPPTIPHSRHIRRFILTPFLPRFFFNVTWNSQRIIPFLN